MHCIISWQFMLKKYLKKTKEMQWKLESINVLTIWQLDQSNAWYQKYFPFNVLFVINLQMCVYVHYIYKKNLQPFCLSVFNFSRFCLFIIIVSLIKHVQHFSPDLDLQIFLLKHHWRDIVCHIYNYKCTVESVPLHVIEWVILQKIHFKTIYFSSKENK